MKRALIIILMNFLLIAYSHCQFIAKYSNEASLRTADEESSLSYFNLPSIVMPSPNAASLGIYGKIPVGLYTGTPNISIPLYEINLDGKSIPITLSYRASGIKVMQEASWVGLGWNLQAGGCIVSEIRGSSDFGEYDIPGGPNGYYYEQDWPYFIDSLNNKVDFPALAYAYNNGNKPAVTHDQYLYDHYFEGEYDFEPDLFHFNFGQYSGSMFFKKSKDANPTPQAIIIKDEQHLNAIYNIHNKSWHIQDGDGFSYYFATTEITETYSLTTPFYSKGYRDYIYLKPNHPRDISSWYLDSIVSPKGHTIKFEYGKEQIYTGISIGEDVHYLVDIIAHPNNGSFVSPDKQGIYNRYNQSYSKITQAILKRITYPGGEIIFSTTDRNDIESVDITKKAQKLNNITIKNYRGRVIKQYDLTYSYNGSTNNYNTCRLMLNNIKEPFINREYSFSYNSGILPPKDSYAIDFWGYYNGKEMKAYGNKRSFLLSPPICCETELSLYYFQGKEMRPDESLMQYGTLTEITYPTGGKTYFFYEPHEYINRFKCGDFEIEKASLFHTVKNVHDQPVIGESFELENHVAYGGTPYFFKWGYSWPNDVAPIEMDTYVTLEKLDMQTGKYKIYKTFFAVTSFDESGESFISAPFDIIESGTYRLLIGKSVPNTECYLYATLCTYQTQYCNTGGGLRIKETIDIDQDNIVTRKLYKYTNGEGKTSSGILMVEPLPYCRFIASSGIWITYTYEYLCAYYNYNPLGDCGSGSPVGYSYVKEIVENQDEYGITTNFYYNHQEEPELRGHFIPSFPATPNPRNGQLISRLYYNKDGDIKKIQDYFYTTTTKSQAKGIKLYRPAYASAGSLDESTCKLYDINTTNSTLDKIIETSIEGDQKSDTVINEYTYQYNSVNRLKSKDISFDNGTKTYKSLEIKYPSDYNIPPYTNMVSRHLVNVPVEVIERKNDMVTAASRQLYKDTLNMWLPTQTDRLRVNRPDYMNESNYQMESEYKYNKQGNISEIIMKDGSHVVYLWSYRGLYPIAEIKNSTYQEVEQILKKSVIESLAKADLPNIDMEKIEGLRSQMPNAHVTTYTYEPLVGIKSITAPNGSRIYYEYDVAGRLMSKYMLNANGNRETIEQYDYNYKER